MKDTGSKVMTKSLYNNLRHIRLTPDQTKELKPLSATNRLGTKTAQSTISQPQNLIPEKNEIRINYETNCQRSAREVERTTREIESTPIKKSTKVVESNDSKLVELLPQSDTGVVSSPNEEERKEHRMAKSKVHLRPGRLERPDRITEVDQTSRKRTYKTQHSSDQGSYETETSNGNQVGPYPSPASRSSDKKLKLTSQL